mgnify:CR=1 FL=1
MNTKTSETNAQVIERMAFAFDLMEEEKANKVEKKDLVSKEERKVILKSIAKVAGKGTGEQLVNYIDQLSVGLLALNA